MDPDDPERIVKPGFHRVVYDLVRTVPTGAVTAYGDVAAALGSPRVARHVGWALSSITERDADVPWHRVVNSQGRVSHRGDTGRASEQQIRLEAEGIEFDESGKIRGWKQLRYRFVG